MTSDDFIRDGEDKKEQLSKDTAVPAYELHVLQAENLKKVVATYGEQKVFRDGPENVAGMVYPDELKPYISLDVLSDLELSKHVAEHEGIHVATKSFIHDYPKDITVFEGQYDALDEALQAVGVAKDGIQWVEGFTEGLAQRRLRDGHQGAYGPDVRAAEKLDALCLEKTGHSLFDAFEKDDRPLFTLLLRRLGGVLLLEKAVDHFVEQDGDVAMMRGEMERKLRTAPPVARSPEEAEKAVLKVIAEIIASPGNRRYGKRDENFSGLSASSSMLS